VLQCVVVRCSVFQCHTCGNTATGICSFSARFYTCNEFPSLQQVSVSATLQNLSLVDVQFVPFFIEIMNSRE